jgi:plasmid stabilization system protein ParE
VARRLVITIARAKREIAAARIWWRKNRDKAPLAFDEDIDRTFALILDHPEVGAKVGGTRRPGARRLYLERIRYYLYYEVEEGAIIILSLTHTARRRLPRL